MFNLIKAHAWTVILLLVELSATTIFTGCVSAEVGLDSATRQVLQNAIDQLGNQPGAWQNTMQNTIDELGRVGTQSAKDALADVQATYNGALGQTEGAVFCGADFVGRRLQQRMRDILHKFDRNAPAPTIVPVICSTNPGDHIDVGATRLVTYYGYDFLEFSSKHTFTAALQYANGQVVKPNFGFVAIPHNYELTIDLQAVDYTNVDRARGPQLVLKWGEQKVGGEGSQSELAVLFPAIPTPHPTVAPTPQIVSCGPFGGGGGGSLSESFKTPPIGVLVRAGEYVDSIQMIYSTGPGDRWGGSGGSSNPINLNPGEYIQGIGIRSGQYVDSITIYTNLRTFGPYGGGGGAQQPLCGGPGWQVIGILGRGGQYVDALGVTLQRR